MEVTQNRLDCEPFLKREEQPICFFNVANADGLWCSLDSVVTPGEDPAWAFTAEGEQRVRIPMFSYTTGRKDVSDVFATGCHLATQVMASAMAEHNLEIDHIHIVVGDVYDNGNGYQVWIGVALHLR